MIGQRVCLFGGTFDPPHLAHLLIAQIASEQWRSDQVIFIPTGSPPHKSIERVSDARDRKRMVELAISDFPDFSISDLELDRAGVSYTTDTVKQVRAQLPDASLGLLLGADMLATFPSWKSAQDIVALAELIVAPRPEVDMPAALRGLRDVYPQATVTVLQMPALDLSSSWLRDRLVARTRTDFLLLPGVAAYIAQKGLYRQ